MILLIDNYDSFSYNLVQLTGSICEDEIKVIRNDEMTVKEIRGLKPTHIILSPGPGRPAEAGICEEAVIKLKDEIPILGVCLGHQGICEAFGGNITYASSLMHGKQRKVTLNTDSDLFKGLKKTIPVARYHSLAADRNTLPEELKVIATAEDGDIMAVGHIKYPIYGVQFHPESVLTPDGKTIMENFLKLT